MNDAGRIGFLIKGNYSGTVTYNFLDVVYYNGSSYVAKKTAIGNIPAEDSEYWHIFAKGSQSPVTGVKGDKESEYRHGDVNITSENIGALSKTGDSKDNTVTFTSGDTANPATWVDVGVLSSGEKHSSLLSKISNMLRNTRFLRNIIGTTSISGIGDGTVTGAIQNINTDLSAANTAIQGKAPSDHNHDGRYYTESEVNNLLNGKSTVQVITKTFTISSSSASQSITWEDTKNLIYLGSMCNYVRLDSYYQTRSISFDSYRGVYALERTSAASWGGQTGWVFFLKIT